MDSLINSTFVNMAKKPWTPFPLYSLAKVQILSGSRHKKEQFYWIEDKYNVQKTIKTHRGSNLINEEFYISLEATVYLKLPAYDTEAAELYTPGDKIGETMECTIKQNKISFIIREVDNIEKVLQTMICYDTRPDSKHNAVLVTKGWTTGNNEYSTTAEDVDSESS